MRITLLLAVLAVCSFRSHCQYVPIIPTFENWSVDHADRPIHRPSEKSPKVTKASCNIGTLQTYIPPALAKNIEVKRPQPTENPPAQSGQVDPRTKEALVISTATLSMALAFVPVVGPILSASAGMLSMGMSFLDDGQKSISADDVEALIQKSSERLLDYVDDKFRATVVSGLGDAYQALQRAWVEVERHSDEGPARALKYVDALHEAYSNNAHTFMPENEAAASFEAYIYVFQHVVVGYNAVAYYYIHAYHQLVHNVCSAQNAQKYVNEYALSCPQAKHALDNAYADILDLLTRLSGRLDTAISTVTKRWLPKSLLKENLSKLRALCDAQGSPLVDSLKALENQFNTVPEYQACTASPGAIQLNETTLTSACKLDWRFTEGFVGTSTASCSREVPGGQTCTITVVSDEAWVQQVQPDNRPDYVRQKEVQDLGFQLLAAKQCVEEFEETYDLQKAAQYIQYSYLDLNTTIHNARDKFSKMRDSVEEINRQAQEAEQTSEQAQEEEQIVNPQSSKYKPLRKAVTSQQRQDTGNLTPQSDKPEQADKQSSGEEQISSSNGDSMSRDGGRDDNSLTSDGDKDRSI